MLLRKLLLAVTSLVLVASSLAVARQTQTPAPTAPDSVQRPNRPGRFGMHGGRGMRRERMGAGLRELNLTDEQKEQTRAIVQRQLTSTKAQREELFQLREKRLAGTFTADDETRAKALHQELAQMRRSIHDEISGVLTPEQRTQLEQMREARKTRREQMIKRRQEFQNRKPE